MPYYLRNKAVIIVSKWQGRSHEAEVPQKREINQQSRIMEFEKIKKYLQKEQQQQQQEHEDEHSKINKLPHKFFDAFIISGALFTDLLESSAGRILCAFRVPPRLLNKAKELHGGAVASLVDLVGSAVVSSAGRISTGVSVEISVSYLDSSPLHEHEEIEIEGKALRIENAIAVVSVELRKKATGKIIALGRHTKYLLANSKL